MRGRLAALPAEHEPALIVLLQRNPRFNFLVGFENRLDLEARKRI